MAADMFVILPVMYIMNQIDWTQSQNILYARVLYGVAQVFIIGFLAFLYQAINTKKDQTKVTVKQAAQWGTPAGPDIEQSVQEYDMAQLKKYATQVLFGAAMVTFIHFKWAMIQPLFIQTVMTPMQLYKNPLFQIFVMGQRGDIEKRPFKEENPFAAAFSGMAAATEETPAEGAADASTEQPEALTNGPATEEAAKKRRKQKAKRAE